MKITKHQKRVIQLIKVDGFVMKCQRSFGTSWWISKDSGDGCRSSETLMKSTAEALLHLKLVQLKRVDKYKHEHYKLTKLGKAIKIN